VASPLSFPFSIPLPFIFQEAKESIDEEDPRPTSSNGACITKELRRKSESKGDQDAEGLFTRGRPGKKEFKGKKGIRSKSKEGKKR